MYIYIYTRIFLFMCIERGDIHIYKDYIWAIYNVVGLGVPSRGSLPEPFNDGSTLPEQLLQGFWSCKRRFVHRPRRNSEDGFSLAY